MSSTIRIIIEYEVYKEINQVQIACHIWNLQRIHILSTADIDCNPELFNKCKKGIYRAEIQIPKNLIAIGIYQIEVVCEIPDMYLIDFKEGLMFEINAIDSDSINWSESRQDVIIAVPLKWNYLNTNNFHEIEE